MEVPAVHNNLSYGSMEPPDTPPNMPIDKLFPALLKCFGIILCGYVAGRANIITSTQAKGLGNFVSKFALPALLFKNMVLLDFNNVIWPFLWSILIAKGSVFIIVSVITLLVASPETRFSKTGLFAIFATQSNDFALGYPIVEALYKNSHPEYLQYIYLVAPVSLMILNPIGFVFCEIQRWRDQKDRQQSKLHVVGVVLTQVLMNPIVFMVVIGITFHFILDRNIPVFMEQFVDGLANSFGGAALFYLGLSMVGQLGKFTKSTVISLILLITAQLLVMPLICREMVELLDSDNSSSALNHSSLSNYAFLYGVFPTAPSVAIYAAHYNMEIEVITSGMVISTFLSAPIMYVSAWLLTIPWMDPKPLMDSLQNVSFNVSIISLVTLVWTVTVMFLSKKSKRLPHMFTINLFLAQILVCVGMILWNFVVRQDNFIGCVLTFTLLYCSLYSTYVWSGLIAFALVLMKRGGELKVAPGYLVIAGWGVPAVVSAVLLLSGERMPDTIDSSLFYGRPQVICTSVVLSFSILLAGASLMSLSRGTWDHKYQVLERDCVLDTTEDLRSQTVPDMCEPAENQTLSRECQMCDCAPPEPLPDITNMTDALLIHPGYCGSVCESPGCLLAQEEQQRQLADRQVARHVLLCLLLTVGLLANLSSCLWWLFNQVPGRLYLELQFFCAVVNYGQGFISFGIFGLDKHLIILPFKKKISSLWPRRKREEAPPRVLSDDVVMTCTQFATYPQRRNCVRDIVHQRRCGERTSADTFLGSEMVDWLLQAGLSQDRGEALLYGRRLQRGGVLQHVTREYNFQDDNLHYRFMA
ncbi:integral membrane protein GPR155 [Esox lucius]|uniref:DEP domain-containing protein n=1 Tax=Esox lucius TaxID=8010 RepID=A0A6Q2YM48_ESOLU|nr:integral membrane protein GPR155 [Esox lucius]